MIPCSSKCSNSCFATANFSGDSRLALAQVGGGVHWFAYDE